MQKVGLVVHVIARELYDMTWALMEIAGGHDMGEAAVANADEGKSGPKSGARTLDKQGQATGGA